MKLFLSLVLCFLATATGVHHNISIDFSKLKVHPNVITMQPLVVADPNTITEINNATMATSSTQFPYHVKLFLETPGQLKNSKNKSYTTCSGAIISPKWVITAAHCLINAGRGYIFVGCVNTLMEKKGGCKRIRVRPNKYFLHRNFISNKTDIKYDIGLIRLRRVLKFSDKINKIHLNTDVNIPFGQNAVVSGFGFYKNGTLSQNLNFTIVQILDEDKCKKIYPTFNSTMICVSANSQTSDCQGDSGAPLTINKNGKVSLVGIVSYGGPTCQNYPGVYTRITAFMDWICTITGSIVQGCPKKWRNIHTG